jgi:hypothetical protein
MEELAMPSDGDLRQPYGPGWEDPDWTPRAESAAEPHGVCADGGPATLGQFMENLRRVAVGQPAANAKRLGPKARTGLAVAAGQTRRWVVATGASLLAVGTFALPRSARPPEASSLRQNAQADAPDTARSPLEADPSRDARH